MFYGRLPRSRDSSSLLIRDSFFLARALAARAGVARPWRSGPAQIGSTRHRLSSAHGVSARLRAGRQFFAGRFVPHTAQRGTDQTSIARTGAGQQRLGAQTEQVGTGRGRDASAHERHGSRSWRACRTVSLTWRTIRPPRHRARLNSSAARGRHRTGAGGHRSASWRGGPA